MFILKTKFVYPYLKQYLMFMLQTIVYVHVTNNTYLMLGHSRRGLFCISFMDADAQTGCICSTTFYTETLVPADTWMEILFNISHSSSSKRIASLDRAWVSFITRELYHQAVLLMASCNTLIIPRGKQEMLVRRSTKPNIDGLAKAYNFRAVDARYASAALVNLFDAIQFMIILNALCCKSLPRVSEEYE